MGDQANEAILPLDLAANPPTLSLVFPENELEKAVQKSDHIGKLKSPYQTY